MRTLNLPKAFEAFSSVMDEKKSISAKECTAVERLNHALTQTGYRIMPMNPQPHGKDRSRARGTRDKNRKQKPHKRSIGVAMRRPGRPKLRQVA
jgi:hypothetical protein